MSYEELATKTTDNVVAPADVNQLNDNISYIKGYTTGTIIAYGGTSAPTGAVVCDGSAYSRTTYADLFSEIGTTWGVGDGSTTFNVPDLQGVFCVGRVHMDH